MSDRYMVAMDAAMNTKAIHDGLDGLIRAARVDKYDCSIVTTNRVDLEAAAEKLNKLLALLEAFKK